MIQSLHIKGFKSLRDTDVRFNEQGITVLMGPNGAGKSTLLEAIGVVHDLSRRPFAEGLLAGWAHRSLAFQGNTEEPLRFSANFPVRSTGVERIQWRMELRCFDRGPHQLQEDSIFWGPESLSGLADPKTRQMGHRRIGSANRVIAAPIDRSFLSSVAPGWVASDQDAATWFPRAIALQGELGPVRIARLNPVRVAVSPPVLSDVAEDGFGLPSMLHHLWSDSRKSFFALEESFRKLFPWVEEVLLPVSKNAPPGGGHETVVDLRFRDRGSAGQYPASAASSGMLMALTLLWIVHRPDPDRILCIEEPENSMHPYLLKEIYDLLGRASRGEMGGPPIQVIVTTHSVDFVNLCKPEEIRICERDADGAVKVSSIHDRADLEKAIETFRGALGDLWYSGAIGGLPETSAGNATK